MTIHPLQHAWMHSRRRDTREQGSASHTTRTCEGRGEVCADGQHDASRVIATARSRLDDVHTALVRVVGTDATCLHASPNPAFQKWSEWRSPYISAACVTLGVWHCDRGLPRIASVSMRRPVFGFEWRAVVVVMVVVVAVAAR
jgi:hypothetical protein